MWQGATTELAKLGGADDAGDTAIERGYSALLRAHRQRGAA